MRFPDLDHYSYLIDEQHRLLLIGIVVLGLSAIFTLSGTTFERYGRIVSRTEKPRQFWWSVVGWFCVGLFFVGFYLYQESR